MMKYLRVFEGFGDDYYVEISEDEYNRFVYRDNNKENFTNREIKWLTDNLEVDPGSIPAKNRQVWSCIFNNRSSIMFKLEDGWFLVNIRDAPGVYYRLDMYYKCDQWDGLIELLKDLDLIK